MWFNFPPDLSLAALSLAALSPVGDASSAAGPGLSRRRLLRVGAAAPLALLAAPPVAPAALARPAPVAGRRIVSEGSPVLRSTVLTVRGQAMHTLVSTAEVPADAPPVVLVHGLALSGQYTVPTAEALAGSYPVYIPDFPGFGDSHKPGRVLDVPRLADALADWMAAASLDRAVLLGNSFGCQIIAELADRHPERVAAGVLQGPTTPPDERSWAWQFIRWRQNAPFNPPEMDAIAAIDYAKCGFVRALRTFEFSLRDGIEDKAGRIRAPMLVVRGAEDPICRQDWAEQVAGALPEGELVVIPEVAHTLVFTAPEELAAVSRRFIESAAPTA